MEVDISCGYHTLGGKVMMEILSISLTINPQINSICMKLGGGDKE